MGNIAEVGGWSGDTRLPSDDEELSQQEYASLQERKANMMLGDQAHMFTYRNGVNYMKDLDESVSLANLSRTESPVDRSQRPGFGGQIVAPITTDRASNSMKSASAKLQNSTPRKQPLPMAYGTSLIPKNILLKFMEHYQRDHVELEQIWEAYENLLHDQALEALDKEEMESTGVRSSILVTDSSAYFNGGSNMGRMISTAKLYDEGKNYMNAEEIRATAAGKLGDYLQQFRSQEEKCFSEDDEGSNSMVEFDRKKSYKPFVSTLSFDEKPSYSVVQLDFDDFFELMKLKIAFQHRSIQLMQSNQNQRDIKSSDYKTQISSKSSIKLQKAKKKCNLVLDSQQRDVSCIFWPEFPRMQTLQNNAVVREPAGDSDFVAVTHPKMFLRKEQLSEVSSYLAVSAAHTHNTHADYNINSRQMLSQQPSVEIAKNIKDATPAILVENASSLSHHEESEECEITGEVTGSAQEATDDECVQRLDGSVRSHSNFRISRAGYEEQKHPYVATTSIKKRGRQRPLRVQLTDTSMPISYYRCASNKTPSRTSDLGAPPVKIKVIDDAESLESPVRDMKNEIDVRDEKVFSQPPIKRSYLQVEPISFYQNLQVIKTASTENNTVLIQPYSVLNQSGSDLSERMIPFVRA